MVKSLLPVLVPHIPGQVPVPGRVGNQSTSNQYQVPGTGTRVPTVYTLPGQVLYCIPGTSYLVSIAIDYLVVPTRILTVWFIAGSFFLLQNYVSKG